MNSMKTKFFQRIIALVCMAALMAGCVFGSTTDVMAAGGADAPSTLWLVGDSTVCEFDDATYYYPRYGYGTQIGNYLDSTYQVKNLAMSGRSSLSFLSEENYNTLKSGMKAGDVLIIGFGHNDEKAEAARYTNPNGDYTTPGSFAYILYEKYVKPAKAAGVEVILCTPIVRRTENANFSQSQLHVTTTATADGVTYEGGDYAQAIRDLGIAADVPVVDLTELTKELYLSLGASETLNLHAWTSSKAASVDNTHINIYGAKKVAYLLANAIKATNTTVASHIVLGAEPTKAELVVNPKYVEKEYDNNLEQSKLWKDYGIFKGTVFGDVGGSDKITTEKFALGEDANGNMRVAALGGNGKIGSTDGIAMYYYKIPATSTFSFSAKATVNSINSDSQVAFGLTARDAMYIDVSDKSILVDYVAAGTFGASSTNCFYRQATKLGKGPALSKETVAAGKTYDLSIVSNSDGYACTFGSEPTQTGGFDFALTSIDSEYVYIGMFVSRKADVSFSDIKLTIDGVEVDITGQIPFEPKPPVNPSPIPNPSPGPVVPGEQPKPDPEKGEYIGNINTELLELSLGETNTGLSYIYGNIVVVQWLQDAEGNVTSTVPDEKPTMKFVTSDGEELEVYVTPNGTNAYYFDRFIGPLDAGKEYKFEISLTDEKNVSIYKKQFVNTNTSPVKEKRMGLVQGHKVGYYTADDGALILKSYDGEYKAAVNSNLEKVECQVSEFGNFVSGQVLVVEWLLDAQDNPVASTVPWMAPKLSFVEKGYDTGIDCYVASIDGTNMFYFDRNLSEDMDPSKEYLFKLESGDSDNVSGLNWMYLTTNYMDLKEGLLWETNTQKIMYKTTPYNGDNALTVYAVNK